MRLGIYGGTFDPVHLGHLILAETCREACRLDEVWFMPAYINPHKLDRPGTLAKHRVEMLRFAVAGHSGFRVSTLETSKTSPSFTVETLRTIRAERPDDELFLLMGMDSLSEFTTWKEPDAIVEMSTLVAVNRGARRPIPEGFPARYQDRLVSIEMPAIELSASEIRERAGSGRSIRYRTPRAVELYIQQNRLYDAGT